MHLWDAPKREHSQQVRPVLVIQVENRSNNSASATEIGECLSRIESRTGARFSEYEVVHTFGQTATIETGGLKIHHVDASDIADNKKIRVVFFKENLSTGWDCPRAEYAKIKLDSWEKAVIDEESRRDDFVC